MFTLKALIFIFIFFQSLILSVKLPSDGINLSDDSDIKGYKKLRIDFKGLSGFNLKEITSVGDLDDDSYSELYFVLLNQSKEFIKSYYLSGIFLRNISSSSVSFEPPAETYHGGFVQQMIDDWDELPEKLFIPLEKFNEDRFNDFFMRTSSALSFYFFFGSQNSYERKLYPFPRTVISAQDNFEFKSRNYKTFMVGDVANLDRSLVGFIIEDSTKKTNFISLYDYKYFIYSKRFNSLDFVHYSFHSEDEYLFDKIFGLSDLNADGYDEFCISAFNSNKDFILRVISGNGLESKSEYHFLEIGWFNIILRNYAALALEYTVTSIGSFYGTVYKDFAVLYNNNLYFFKGDTVYSNVDLSEFETNASVSMFAFTMLFTNNTIGGILYEDSVIKFTKDIKAGKDLDHDGFDDIVVSSLLYSNVSSDDSLKEYKQKNIRFLYIIYGQSKFISYSSHSGHTDRDFVTTTISIGAVSELKTVFELTLSPIYGRGYYDLIISAEKDEKDKSDDLSVYILRGYADDCPIGTEEVADNPSLDPEDRTYICKFCADGSYVNENTLGGCQTCPIGYISNSSRSDCSICPPGTYYNSSSFKCVVCKDSYISSFAGLSSCTLCGLGYTNNASHTKCVKCKPGTFTPRTWNTCVQCPAGQESNLERTECVDCKVGYYNQDIGGSCKVCPNGSVSSTSGSVLCTFCGPSGYTNENISDGNECKLCSPGYEVNKLKDGCNRCEKGYFSKDGSICMP